MFLLQYGVLFMYDYKKDDEQLSNRNNKGTFVDGGNLSSDFKLQKENLPQWAVDWARNRFNMDAKSVKFYVMDRQEADDSVALASGNNVFVTSDQRNNETVIKHELTHIYQQAIGTATESNASDTSLEDEAVQVSKEEDISLAKNQTLSDRYILPRKKTNVVQFFGALTIAEWVIEKLIILGVTLLSMWLVKQMKYKKIARKSGAPLKTVKMVCDIFELNDKNMDEIVDLCTTLQEKSISDSQLRQDSAALKKIEEFKIDPSPNEVLKRYNIMLKNGFRGFEKEKETLSKYFNVDIGDVMFEPSKSVKLKRKRYNFDEDWDSTKNSSKITIGPQDNRAFVVIDGENIKIQEVDPREGPRKLYTYEFLYYLTSGFKDRTIEQVQEDINILFGCSLEYMPVDQIEEYDLIYNGLDKLERGAENVQKDVKLFFDCDISNISETQLYEYFSLYEESKKFTKKTSQEIKKSVEDISGYSFWYTIQYIEWHSLVRDTEWFNKITPQEFVNVRDKLAAFLNIKKDNTEAWMKLVREIADYLLYKTDCFRSISVDTFINRLEDLIENGYDYIADKYERMKQDHGYCASFLGSIFTKCIESLETFPELHGKELAIMFMTYEVLSKVYPMKSQQELVQLTYLNTNTSGALSNLINTINNQN